MDDSTKKRPAWWIDDPRCESSATVRETKTASQTSQARRMATAAGTAREARRQEERDRQHMEEAMSDHRDFEKLFASGPFKHHGSLSALMDFNERNGLPLPESVRAMREEFERRMDDKAAR